ncbi:hypothetical protein [Paraburkholderia bannensis]|uniref:hypothetical protein n=1 Tax=Paraburkholderia bannensis TaxID=765414 RepID=UPI002AB1D5B8|nr:hypothetical protein [Paraburkholderia bannensis]
MEDLTVEQNRRWLANFFKAKVAEYSYHLKQIIDGCDESLQIFKNQQPQPEGLGRRVIYAFGSLSNALQTLKDSSETFLSPNITWGDVRKLRHGSFFYLSRNAATHDGNPVISAWVDGKFHVPQDIKRFHDGKVISIPAPSEDAKTFCLEFSADLSEFLIGRLESIDVAMRDLGPMYDASEIALMMQSQIVPEFAKKLVNAQLDNIRAMLANVRVDPIGGALDELRKLANYCQSASKTNQN